MLLLGLSGALVANALAQIDPPPRTDPGTAPETPGGASEGWKILSIPGLPAHAILGDVWAAADGHVYVWARYPSSGGATGAALEEPGEGERLPGPSTGHASWSSSLYRFDGMSWTMMLRTPGEEGVALLGTDCDHLFASTTSAQGEARLYRYDGLRWIQEIMPGYYLGRMHTLAGVPGDTYFRIDRAILRHDGTRLWPMFELPGEEPPVRGLVYLGADGLFVMGSQGHWLHDMGVWTAVPAGFAFADVQDAWGTRDAQGVLQMYVVGSNAHENGLRLWRFQETDRVTHAGSWTPVLSDPPGAGIPDIGRGLHLWGFTGNDVYATGVVEGQGHMFHFDGNAWAHLVAPASLGTVHGVWGTPQGVVWFSTESGSLVRYQRGNRAPDLSAAHPSVDRLWPADLRLVLVDIRGIVDPDGDAVSIAIDGVTQDEDPITPGTHAMCPDAVVNGSHVYLRAEHAPNGDGRTYDIEYTATDRLGATSSGHVHVCAPHFGTSPCTPDAETFVATGPCAAPTTDRGPLEANELRGALQIRYEIEESAQVHLGVYDLAGRLRGTVEEGMREPGVHETSWDLGALNPGVYFVKLRAKGPAVVRRVIVLH